MQQWHDKQVNSRPWGCRQTDAPAGGVAVAVWSMHAPLLHRHHRAQLRARQVGVAEASASAVALTAALEHHCQRATRYLPQLPRAPHTRGFLTTPPLPVALCLLCIHHVPFSRRHHKLTAAGQGD
jgi:hypothetical protein